MSETADRYRRIAAAFAARVDAVDPPHWSDPSPCSEWTARDVAAHVIGTNRRVVASLDGSEPVPVDSEGDLARQWQEASEAVGEALDDQARASRTTSGMFGEQSFESLVSRLLCTDTLIHTWDLARATGQDEHLDPDSVTKARAFLESLGDAIRRPGGFAPRIEPAPDADAQTELLNFCGRAV